MRILQAANFVAPHSGGIRTMLRHLAAGYAAAGHEVLVLVPGPRDRLTRTGYGRLVELAAPVVPGSGGYRVITRWARVRRFLEATDPIDVVEVSDKLTLSRIGPWARRRGIGSVVFSHERLDALLGFHLGRWLPATATSALADTRNRRLARSFDTVVCTTRWAAEEFERLGGLARLAHVPLGIDLDTFAPRHRDEALRRRLLQGAQVLVACAVRLSAEKRPDLLVPALVELRRRGVDARLVICGDGPSRGAVERQAAGQPVTLMGFVAERAELARLLASADVAVAPGPYETFGLAALEAMACGTPVVASASGALPELVRPGCGLTAASDPAAMAAALARVLSTPGLRPDGPRRRAEDFSWEATVAQMLAVHGLDSRSRNGGEAPAEASGSLRWQHGNRRTRRRAR